MLYIVTRLDKNGYAVAEYACRREKTALYLAAQALDLDPDEPHGMDWDWDWIGSPSVRNYFNCFEQLGTRPDVLITCYR